MMKKNYIKDITKALLLSVILFLLYFSIRYPEEAVAASTQGMKLWLNTLIPTLLPFIILTSILIKTNMIDKILSPFSRLWKILFGLSPLGVYAFFAGMLCGYPMGAKVTSDLFENDKISRREAQYLLTFSNNASPAFITNYLYLTCLNKRIPLTEITGTFILSTVICMLFFRFIVFHNKTTTNTCAPVVKSCVQQNSKILKFHNPQNNDTLHSSSTYTHDSKKETSTASYFGTIIDVSIMNGFETITRLGGYILLFSLICAVTNHYYFFPPYIQLFLSSSIELTTGLHQISAASVLPYSSKYAAAICLTAFGGFSIMAQTRGVVNKKLSILPYFCAKLLNTAICALLVFIQI